MGTLCPEWQQSLREVLCAYALPAGHALRTIEGHTLVISKEIPLHRRVLHRVPSRDRRGE